MLQVLSRYSEGGSQFGYANGIDIVCTNGYLTNLDANYDYAVVRLESNVGNTTGYFGYAAIDDSSMTNQDITILGFPGDKSEGTMWRASGKISSLSSGYLNHTADTMAGQSGATIQRVLGPYTVVGVHTGHNNISLTNGAVRMTSSVVNFINSYYYNINIICNT